MGLFNKFKSFLSDEPKVNTAGQELMSQTEIVKSNFSIHPDLIDLVWIGDGKYKNYSNQPQSNMTYPYEGFAIKISAFGPNEPSLLYLKFPIEQPEPSELVERPPYYPFYSELTPKQKYLYWKFLSDPYNPSNDIGYAFIFYYGLERHLLYGNFDQAFDIILKLRDVYNNRSFQNYSASALILSSMIHKRADCAKKFMNSLDKEYEFQMPGELYFLCKLGLNIPITAYDIVKFHKFFGFSNNRYIKNNYDLFIKNLTNNIIEINNGNDLLNAKIYFTESDFLNTKTIPVFANVSIREKDVSIPDITKASNFMGTIFTLLDKAHKDTKKELAEIRKKKKSHKNIENNTNDVQLLPLNYSDIISDFKKLNEIISLYTSSLGLPKLEIDPEDFVYSGQNPSHFELVPLTKTGKQPKFKKVFYYRTKDYSSSEPVKKYFGDIYYLQNGDIGKAKMIFWIKRTMYHITLKIINEKLCINKIEYITEDSNREIVYKINEKCLPKNNPAKTISVADEILKFKQLLDIGAITEKEFETKKKELLNL